MTTLRILLSDPPQADRADPWALFADDGRAVRHGRDVPAAWPAAARIDAVVASDRTRLVVLTLPPLAPDRLPTAVGYALEDQLAGGGDPPRIAIGAQGADGRVVAAVADRALIEGIERSGAFTHIVPESALPGFDDGWTWRHGTSGQGFLTTPAGAFAVTMVEGGDLARLAGNVAPELPPELAAALAQARRAQRTPAAIRVAFDADPALLARYTESAGVPFVAAPAWRWTDATGDDSGVPDWNAPVPRAPEHERAVRTAWFRPALVLASLALALHVGATLVQWAALHFNAWRVARDTIALAQGAGVTDASTSSAAIAGLVRQHADARHRAGLAAPGDALPLLAQAAPALTALPSAALRSATYGDGAWTLELAKVDAAALVRLDRSLGERGLAVLQAPTAAGSRLRITASP